ncbi:MAG: hypothetical protein E7600_01155 [Ruminococcaceae bacterium]|nr:hypothetical protein [Oscillospiraceae bacterium]
MNKKNERFIDLEQRINDYFLYCDAVNESKEEMVKPYTLSGLLCYIGISRQEFEKISKTKRYQKLISRAKSKIEAFIEENALTGELSISAATNSLKYNFGWGEKADRNESEEHGPLTVVLSPETQEFAK